MSDRVERRAKVVLWGSMVVSVVLHALASSALSLLPSTSVALAATQRERIEFEVEDEPPPREPEVVPDAERAPEPQPEPETQVVTPPREVTPPTAREPRARDEPEPPPAAPQAEQVHDMGGLVLGTTGPGAGWTTAAGTGQDTTGPIGNPVARTTGRNVAGRADGTPGGTGTAAAQPTARVNQSRPPRAPGGMAQLLERAYPTGARARGVEGRARVMFRVLASGQAEPQSIASEIPAGEGFGRACIEAVRASSGWTPAVDEDGSVVTSRLYPYDCRFRQR